MTGAADKSTSRLSPWRGPTALVERGDRPGLAQAASVAGFERPTLLQVGPYAVLRPLVRAPGVFLAEARGPHTEAVLLQMAPIRALGNENEEAPARRRVERMLARRTAALFSERNITVMAHGGATREDGARVLFWALPWRPDVERLLNTPLYVEGAEHLVVLARSLAQRLARRHLLGGFDPLLSEYTILVQSDGADVLGVPVAVPPEWLAPEAPPLRWAPEELASGEPTRGGDLWRLGHALAALGSPFETVPRGLAQLVARLTQPDPEARPPRATEVVVELDAIHAALGRGVPLVPLEATPTALLETLSPSDLSVLLQSAVGNTTCQVMPDPAVLIGEPTIADQSLDATLQDLAPAELVDPAGGPLLNDAPMMDEVPPWAFFFSLDELRRFLRVVSADLMRRELDFLFGTGVVQLALPDGGSFYYLGLVPLAHACHQAPAASWEDLVRDDFDGLLEATAQAPEQRRFRAEAAPPPVSPQGATLLDTEAVVPPVTDHPGAGPTLVLGAAPRSASPAPLARLPSTSSATASPGRGRGYFWGGLAALLLFGAILIGARHLEPDAWRTRAISMAHRVEVEAEPAGAIVVAERDGRVLGAAPQSFWVGPDADAVVLVSAPGFEPQRVVLPARGRMRIELEPLPSDAAPCALDLPESDRRELEAVGASWSGPGRLVVQGAAVIRGRPDVGREGAWLVRCPTLGGVGRVSLERPRVRAVELSIEVSPGQEVEVSGVRQAGGVPHQVRGAFTTVRVGSEERWIPTTVSARLTQLTAQVAE